MEELHLLRLQWSVVQRGPRLVLHCGSVNGEMVQAESEAATIQLPSCLKSITPPFSSPLHVWGLCVDLTLTSVLGVQECAGLLGVLALQPVLIQGVQGGVDLGETDWQAAVGLLHLLDQGFIHPASRLALCLTTAAQAP